MTLRARTWPWVLLAFAACGAPTAITAGLVEHPSVEPPSVDDVPTSGAIARALPPPPIDLATASPELRALYERVDALVSEPRDRARVPRRAHEAARTMADILAVPLEASGDERVVSELLRGLAFAELAWRGVGIEWSADVRAFGECARGVDASDVTSWRAICRERERPEPTEHRPRIPFAESPMRHVLVPSGTLLTQAEAALLRRRLVDWLRARGERVADPAETDRDLERVAAACAAPELARRAALEAPPVVTADVSCANDVCALVVGLNDGAWSAPIGREWDERALVAAVARLARVCEWHRAFPAIHDARHSYARTTVAAYSSSAIAPLEAGMLGAFGRVATQGCPAFARVLLIDQRDAPNRIEGSRAPCLDALLRDLPFTHGARASIVIDTRPRPRASIRGFATDVLALPVPVRGFATEEPPWPPSSHVLPAPPLVAPIGEAHRDAALAIDQCFESAGEAAAGQGARVSVLVGVDGHATSPAIVRVDERDDRPIDEIARRAYRTPDDRREPTVLDRCLLDVAESLPFACTDAPARRIGAFVVRAH